ncbi:MAG: PAS domain S-box protein [Verrucomicrobiaceae bacterium]|nr:MAG: PAS domain S-box protein [Verrucomicrobiaceae bacterium]
MKITLSTPTTPLRDAFYVGLSVLLCFIASAYFIYSQASARNNIHNRQRLEAIAWRTANQLNSAEHARIAAIPTGKVDAKEYLQLQKPVKASKNEEPILSRIYTVAFDNEAPRMVVDSEGFPARTWERLPLQPGKSGDFSKETLYYCALSVYNTGKGWVGEISYPGSTESYVLAMVPVFAAPDVPSGVLVVESTADRLQPTLASLKSAALSSVLIGAVVSLTVALAVYSYRRRNLADANLLATVERTETALIDAIGEAIYRFDPLFDVLSWQGNFADLGWPEAKDIPRSRKAWLACVHPEDIQLCREAWSGSNGPKWNVEYRIIGKNGHVNWLLDRGQYLEINGQKTTAVGTILNLTPLREAERRLRDVVDAAGEYIWEVDSNGHYTYLSERVVDVLGYPLEKMIGHHPLSFVPAEDVEEVRAKSHAIIMREESFRDFEHRMLRGDGKIIWLSVNGVPVNNITGQVTGYRGAGLDITVRKSVEQELIREKEAAQAADRAKSEFLAVMSHEIRTPLNSVMGFADLLNETSLDDGQKEHVDMIRRSGDALLMLLNDILDFSRIESGKMPIQPSAVEVRTCLRDVVDLYRATAQSKGVSLQMDVDPDVPKTLCTDPGRLRQILLNLIGNAVKFTPAGEVLITAKSGEKDPKDGRFPLLIEVSDSGIGIPPDRISRLFKPFSQADSSTTRRFGGTGLGLAICKRLSELLGGDVFLKKSSSSGSVFAVELPLVALPVMDGAPVEDAALESGFDGGHKQSLRVLVVEDNPVNSILAQRMLTSLGFASDSEENGQVGVLRHEQQPYDIIFMDLQMPVMDGLEAASMLRKYEAEHPDVPPAYIIALTADAMTGDRQRCIEAGMNDYLSKPIRRAEMAAVLKKASESIARMRAG